MSVSSSAFEIRLMKVACCKIGICASSTCVETLNKIGGGMEPRDKAITARLAAQGAMLYELQVVAGYLSVNRTREAAYQAVVKQNILHKSSLDARKKIFQKLRTKYFRSDTPQIITRLLRQVQASQDSMEIGLLAYVTLLWNDALVFLLGTEWLPRMANAAMEATTADIEHELKRLEASQALSIRVWSANTRARVARHYLGLLRDCGFATGSAAKQLRWPYVSPQIVGYAAQLILGAGEPTASLPEHQIFTAMGLQVTEVIDRLEEAGYRIQGGAVLVPERGVSS